MANWFDSNKTPQTPMGFHQLMIEQKLQQSASFPPRTGSVLSTLSNGAARRVYQPLTTMQQQQQSPHRLSSTLMNKTLMLLDSHAQRSRLHNLASIATNTSLALELARKKKVEYQQQQEQRRQYQQGLPFQHQQKQIGEVVANPSDVDVLLGRGGRSNHHVGNARFRELIRSNRPQYNNLPKHEKIKLSRAIVGVVQDLGGRFLEPAQDGRYYVVAPNKRAVEKTSQCLREKRADGHQKSASAMAIQTAKSADATDPKQKGTTSKAA